MDYLSLLAVTSALLLFYSLLLLYYKIIWDSISEEQVETKRKPSTFISIIIAARNEEENIGKLLESITEQSYPKNLFEIIVVDDHSTDKTASIIKSFPSVRYFHLQEWVTENFTNSFKKKAISEAIHRAKGKIIVTTDADCVVGENWLASIAQGFDTFNCQALAGPVMFFRPKSVLEQFQVLDFVAMQGITAAVLSSKKGAMCNGANFAYTREAFARVNGYEGIDHLASGDDMMLMDKFAKEFPEEITYLKDRDAIVQTKAMNTFGGFLRQRIRWSSKNKSLSDRKIQLVLLFSWVLNASLVATFVSAFFIKDQWFFALLLLITKSIAEYFFCNEVAAFFDRKKSLPFLFILQPLHILYMTFVGLLGLFNSYTWKQRKVK
jgi:cellulose synthase/poly-beta-1,6-N-acetylglucosamine synthase-like glycosyltransferase